MTVIISFWFTVMMEVTYIYVKSAFEITENKTKIKQKINC